jgi:hypothetical protein
MEAFTQGQGGIVGRKSWANLSTGGKVGVVILATIQCALLVFTLWDIWHRPAEDIRGDRRMWTGLAFINWVGPLAYFTVGRKDVSAAIMERCSCCGTSETSQV